MVVPERPTIEDLKEHKKKPASSFFIWRCLLSLILFFGCGVGIFNTTQKDPLFGINLLVLSWWQISLGLVIAIVLLVPGGDSTNDDLFKMGGGPPIVR